MSLVVGDMYWSHGSVLLCIYHSSRVVYTGVMVVYSCVHVNYEVTRTGGIILCSCVHVTRRGWHVLET